MALTEIAIRAAKAGDKDRKLADSRGLYLLITPTGSKLWRLKFRTDGKERKLSLGRYPEMSLKDARLACEAARSMKQAGAVQPLPSAKSGRQGSCRLATRSARLQRNISPSWSPNSAPL